MDNFEQVCTEDDTGDQPPVHQLPRRIPLRTEMISDMLERDFIQSSKSPWASSIVLVRWIEEILC